MATTRTWNPDGSYTETTRTFDSQWGPFGPTTKEVVYADTHHINGEMTKTTTTTKTRHNCWGEESLIVAKEEHYQLIGRIVTTTTITATEATCFGPRTKTERKSNERWGQPIGPKPINVHISAPTKTKITTSAEEAFNAGAFLAGGLMALLSRK